MSLPQMGSTNEGTAAVRITFPVPWPPVKPQTLHEISISDGEVEIIGEPTGALRCKVSRTGPPLQTVYDVQSCALGVTPGFGGIVVVSWGKTDLHISFLGSVIGHSLHQDTLGPHVFLQVGHRSHTPHREDFLAANANAVVRRRGHVTGWQPKNPNAIVGGREEDFTALREEAEQIRDMLRLLASGSNSHVRGLSNSLAKMIGGRSKGALPLLQRCAARDDKPLIVFSVDEPKKRIPLAPDVEVQFNVAASSSQLLSNPIDLDVLLGIVVMRYGSVSVSYKTLLMEIRNNFGSHSDLEILPEMIILKAFRGAEVRILTNYASKFLICMGELTLALSNELLGIAR
jgi:hypothetical protein